MTRVVFAGPSLPPRNRRGGAGIAFLAPARCGDIARAVVQGARAIGLVDGVFEGARATWHKEILWALSRGVYVAGAASMGALRAAEMHTLGMVGIGRVFNAFRTGTLEDDDEVAVVHAPAELGFHLLSDAMVNIRATLGRAERQGLISPRARGELVRIGKRVFYKERTFDRLFEDAQDLMPHDVAKLRPWVAANKVDVKAADARALLRVLDGKLTPPVPRPRFVRSKYWDSLLLELGLRR